MCNVAGRLRHAAEHHMSEQKPEENPTQKRLANLRPPFEPGNPGGPGRPKGSRNLSTIIREALAAKAPKDYLEKLTARGIVLQEDTWESVLVAVAIGKAASGSIQHFREILDRTEGKPVQPVRASGTLDVAARVIIGLPEVSENGDSTHEPSTEDLNT